MGILSEFDGVVTTEGAGNLTTTFLCVVIVIITVIYMIGHVWYKHRNSPVIVEKIGQKDDHAAEHNREQLSLKKTNNLRPDPDLSFESHDIQNTNIQNVNQRQQLDKICDKSSSNRELVKQCKTGDENASFSIENLTMKEEKHRPHVSTKTGYRLGAISSSVPCNKIEGDNSPHQLRNFLESLKPLRRSSLTKRKRYCDFHNRPVVESDRMFVIKLIKSILPIETQVLNSKTYYLFLRHTVNIILKKTKIQETIVLSILLDDFKECYMHKTKRGHRTWIIDANQSAVVIGKEEAECLELYVDYAREKLVCQLRKNNDAYVDTKYLFIDYSGIPLVEKMRKVAGRIPNLIVRDSGYTDEDMLNYEET